MSQPKQSKVPNRRPSEVSKAPRSVIPGSAVDAGLFGNAKQDKGSHVKANVAGRHRDAKTRQNHLVAGGDTADGHTHQSREPHVGVDVNVVRGAVPSGAQENRGK